MKKFTSLLGLVVALVSNAQITITSADMPSANDSVYISTTTAMNNHQPSETGADYSWDFSDLKPAMQQPQEYDAPGKFPSIYNLLFNPLNTSYGRNDVLLSNTSVLGIKIESAYDFFKKSDASLNQIGIGYMINGTPLPFIYKRADVMYKFPMKYQNTDSCDFKFGLEVPGYGYYGQSGHRHNVVDGWGRVKTPFGSFTALRILSTVNITDTVYSESDSVGFAFKRPTKYEYKWLATGSKVPVLQIDAVLLSGQLLYTATFIDSLRKDIIHVGIEEKSRELASLHVYPNPAQEQFTVEYQLNTSSPVKILLTDLLGKETTVLANEIQSIGMYRQTVSVDALPSGIYFLTLQNDKERVVKKISILH